MGGEDLDDFVIDDIAAGASDGEENSGDEGGADDSGAAAAGASKRKAKDEKLKKKKKAKKDAAPSREDGASMTTLAPSAQAAMLLKFLKQSKVGAGMTDVEAGDIVRAELFVKPPKGSDADLASLPGRLRQLSPAGERRKDVAPGIFVLVPSQERGKAVSDALKSLDPIKAFGSHPKVKKLLIQFLASGKAAGARCIVGTAGRLAKLLEGGQMSPGGVQCVAIDMFRDAKERAILDMAETREDVAGILLLPLRERLRAGDAKIVLF
mmetsp:Transcript_26058/g.62162  ORF Transcript_26058/g.62162 Transcript_26058/m.62162 type:complete len:266 (-) Transcript_26058:36-833(-)